MEVKLDPLTTQEQLEALRTNALDVGLLRTDVAHDDIVVEPLLAEEMVAVVPKGHRLAHLRSIAPAQLANEGLVLFPREMMPGFVGQVWNMLRPHAAELNVVQEAVHHETVVGLVSAGVGISILPASVSRVQTPDIVILPIDGAPRTSLKVATRADENSAVVGNFLRCLDPEGSHR